MLGSLDHADDALQETLLAAWRGVSQFEGRSSVRTWLYRIATTRCLNAIRDAARRPPLAPSPPVEPPVASASFEVSWLQPYPDARLRGTDPSHQVEARANVEIAFVTALQTLPPRQTAALLLCDVLGFTQSEAAQMLDTKASAVKGLLQRARAALPTPPPAPAPQATEVLARKFADAFARDDVDSMVALLTDDAWLAMPPARQRYDGPVAIARFLRASATGRPGGTYRLLPVPAGGHHGFGCYLHGRARGLVVLIPARDASRVSAILRFLDDNLHRHFDLPDEIG